VSTAKLLWRLGGSLLAVVLLAFGLLQVLGLLSHHSEQVEAGTADEAVTSLHVSLESGRVEIVGVDGPRVSLSGSVTSGLVDTSHDARVEGSRYLVSSTCPTLLVAHNCDVDLRIEVPRDLAVEVRSTNTEVVVRDLRGNVDVETSNSRIEAEALAGTVRLRTSNDVVAATGLSATDVEVHSSNDEVRLSFVDPPQRVVVRSSNDDVGIDVPDTPDAYALDLRTSNGNQRADIRTDPTSDRTIDVHTSNGDVTVQYPPSA